ncbi:MAG: hypothetical protein ACK4LB_00810 [Spirosomataceae bacterium]
MNSQAYFAVITAAMIKFFAGPVTGVGLGLHPIEIIVCSWLGMMISVTVFVFAGDWIQRQWKRPRKSSIKSKRRYIKIKQAAGLWGIAFLTPALLSPIGGALVAVAFRYDRKEILTKMAVAGGIWAVVQAYAFNAIRNLF